MQRCDHAERSGAEKARDLFVRMVFLEKHQRFPSRRLKSGVDAFGFAADFGQEILVALDVRAAGRSDLHESETLLVGRVQFEKTLESAETLENPFRVVHAVNANAQKGSLNIHFSAQSGALCARAGRLTDSMRILRKRHADGIRAHPSDVALAIDCETIPFRERLDRTVHGFQKIVTVRLDLEANEVGAQQTIDKFALPRADAKNFRIRPRNVPKNRNTRVGPRFLDHPRKQREVIILREKNRRFRALHFLQNDVRKSAIDFLILYPVLGPADWARMRDMAQRPESLVRKTFVIAFVFLIAKPHAAERVTWMIGRHAEPIVRIDDFAVGAARTVGDPGAIAGAQNRFERGDDAARWNDYAD